MDDAGDGAPRRGWLGAEIHHRHAAPAATGKEQRITITSSSNLNKDEVDRMVREAESHSADDKRKREEAETRNEALRLQYSAENTLKEVGDKVSASDKAEVEKALDDVRSLRVSASSRLRLSSAECDSASRTMRSTSDRKSTRLNSSH